MSLMKAKTIEKVHKLFCDTYLVETDRSLLVVKTDKNGRIVRVSEFGDKERAKHEDGMDCNVDEEQRERYGYVLYRVERKG